MSDQGKKMGNPAWQPGVSGNPKGRPRRQDAIAERVRACVNPDELIKSLLALARYTEARPAERLSAINMLLAYGWGRPVQTTEVDARIEGADQVPANVAAFTPAERAAWIASLPTGKA